MIRRDPFITYLESLRDEDSGTLATLRRACGQRLAESRNCQWFASISTRPPDFLTATLVAQYPTEKIRTGRHSLEYPRQGSIGAAWAEYCRKCDPDHDPSSFYRQRQDCLSEGKSPRRPPSIHDRFRTILDAELDRDGTGELAYRLRGIVRMLVAEEIAIDAVQLARDLRCWRAERRYVQERWAKAFYSPPRTEHKDSEQSVASDDETAECEVEEEEETDAD